MNFRKSNKFVIFLAMVLLLVAGMLPITVFATDETTPSLDAGSVDFEVELEIEGYMPPDGDTFTFVLQSEDGAPLPDDTHASRSGAGYVSFGDIEFTEPGEYHYTISEQNDGLANYTYDTTVYEIEVDVISNRGKLETNVIAYEENDEEDKETALMFVNEYKDETVSTTNPNKETTTSNSNSKVTTTQPSNTTDKSNKSNVKKSTSKTSPQTGDCTGLVFWIVVVCLAFATLIGCKAVDCDKKYCKNDE
jgi:pilin isopeptide linkage protein